MEETISLQEIFAIIKKRITLIIGLIFAAVLVAAVASYFVITPKYEASTKFLVNQGNSEPGAQFNVNDIRTNVELINTYKNIIESTAISGEVVNELNLPYSPSR